MADTDQGAPDHSGASSLGQRPLVRLHLWPFRSLPKRGFVLVIGGTAALLSLPLLAVLGSPVLWGLLPFLLLAVWGLWVALQPQLPRRRDRRGPDDLAGPRHPRAPRPARTAADMAGQPALGRGEPAPEGGPVPHYLTLRGGGREVELGAFLSEPERIALRAEVAAALAACGDGLRRDGDSGPQW